MAFIRCDHANYHSADAAPHAAVVGSSHVRYLYNAAMNGILRMTYPIQELRHPECARIIRGGFKVHSKYSYGMFTKL